MRCANMEELNANCLGCMRCELGKTRTNLVFGVGNDRAEVMLIGEGPGEQEDLQGLLLFWRGGCGGGRSIEFSAHCAPYA